MDLIRKAWFTTGAFYFESFQDFRERLYNSTQPDLVFLRAQAD